MSPPSRGGENEVEVEGEEKGGGQRNQLKINNFVMNC